MTTFSSAKARAAYRSLSLIVLVAAATLGLAATAHAGDYTAKFCVQGAGAQQGGDKGPFERTGNDTVFGLTNNCGDLNGLRVSHNAGQPANVGAEGRWLAERPGGISVVRVEYKASGSEASGGYRAQVIGDADADPEIDIINGGGQLDGDYGDFSAAGDVRRLGVRLICTNDQGPTCSTNPPANPEVRIKDVVYTLSDPAAPALSVTGGSLFDGEVQAGGQTINFEASDTGSGVHRVYVLANGERAGQTDGNCAVAPRFALGFKPCGASLTGELAVNTGAAPWHDGINKVQVCAQDYSTDDTQGVTCSKATNVRVLNGCSTNPAPVNAGQTLNLQWPGKRNAAVQARQGRARTAVATLFGPNGTPLAGAAVCLSRSIPDGRGRERVIEPGAITGADGSVSVKVRGASSRTVYATYWVDPETMITSSLEMQIAPRIKLGLRPGRSLEKGEKMTVVAKLRGRWKADRRVCFYAERPGNDRIGCSVSGDGGRAKTVFKPTDTGRIYFYARVPNQRDYPYVNSRSKKKQARVFD
jgi:hypothetical protein